MADYNRPPGRDAVFYPSPRFQTESPAVSRGDTDSVNHPHIPPPWPPLYRRGPTPANLHPLETSAFNVDPGVPFLATAGPSYAGSQTSSPVEDSPRNKRNRMSAITGGLKNAVKKSLRRERRASSQLEQGTGGVYGSDDFRDSGYASSSRLPQTQRPVSNHQAHGYPVQHPLHAEQRFSIDSPQSQISETLLGHDGYADENKHRRQHQPKNRDEEETLIGHQHEIYVPENIGSPVLAEPGFAQGYIRMSPPTPPPSDPSLNTYISRFRHFVEEVTALPWVARERVTIDYFPGTMSHRADHLQHRPAIAWHSQDFNRNNYHLFFDGDEKSSDDASSVVSSSVMYATPHPGNHADLDLMDEFDSHSHPADPSGAAPPNPPVDLSRRLSRVPQFPNGYVPYAQQHIGLQYGVPVHAAPRIVYATPSRQNARLVTG